MEAFTGRTEEGRCGRAGAGLGKPKAGDGSDWWVLQRREQEKSSLAQWLLLAGAGGSFKFAELRLSPTGDLSGYPNSYLGLAQ